MKITGTAPSIPDLPIIGSIATMPSRARTFSKTLNSVLPQVDKLFIFLDGFDEMPPSIRDLPKCHTTMLPKEQNLHASSRFLAPRIFGSEAVVCFFDDDILYPADYIQKIKHALVKYGDRAVVGFHGVIYLPPHRSYVRDRHTYHFAAKVNRDLTVHELGCGTAAFLSSVLLPDPTAWRNHNMNDIFLAAEAVAAGLKMVALKREATWLTALAENQDDSLWRATKSDDRMHSDFMRDLLTLYARPTGKDWWHKP